MSSNKYLLRQIVMEFAGEAFAEHTTIPRRAAVFVDWLVWLRSRFYMPKGGPVRTHDNAALILLIENLVTGLFRKTDRVFLECDCDKNLPVTKGHTQAARSAASAAILPDYELSLPSNVDLVESHLKAMHNMSLRAALEGETRIRYSFINNEPEDRSWAKLGLPMSEYADLTPFERRRRIIDASLAHPIPNPWESAIESRSGNRARTLPYIVSALAYGQAAYTPPEGTALVINGHYCRPEHFDPESSFGRFLKQNPEIAAALPDWPLVFTREQPEVSPTDIIAVSRIHTIDCGRELPDISVHYTASTRGGAAPINFHNTLGEADHKIFADLDRLHESLRASYPKNEHCYEILSTDVDLFLHALWYLAYKKYVEPAACADAMEVEQDVPPQQLLLPRIIINNKKDSKDQYCDMLSLFTKLDQKLNDADPNPVARAQRIMSYLTVAFAYDSDYTMGYCNIVAATMFAAYFENMAYIGPLVTINTRAPFRNLMVEVDEKAYLHLVLACYYRKYKPHFASAGVLRLTDLGVEQAQRTMDKMHGHKHHASMSNPTMCLKGFSTMITTLSKRFPPTWQLLARFFLIQYYVVMVSQVGSPHVVLPDPLESGFELVNPAQPCSRSNIRFIASNDFDNLTERRKEMILEHLGPSLRSAGPSC